MTTPDSDSRWDQAARALLGGFLVLLVLALIPLTSDPAGPIKRLLTAWAAFGLAVLVSGRLLSGRRGIQSPLPVLLGAWVALHLAAATLSEHRPLGLESVRNWMVLAVLASASAQIIRCEAHFWKVSAWLLFGVALSSVYGAFQYFGIDPFPWSQRGIEEYRGLPSTYANPNFAGHALLPGLVLGLGLLLRAESIRGRLVIAAAMLLMGGHLYLTHMRSARIALLAVLVLFVLFTAARRLNAPPVRAGAAALLVAALLAVLSAGALFGIRGGLEGLDGSLTLRINGYYGAARMVLDRPVTGFGPGAYALENIPYWTPYEAAWFASARRMNDHVHNEWLESAVDAGAGATGLLLVLLIWPMLSSLTLISRSGRGFRIAGYVLAACFAAMAVDSLFGFNLRVPVSAGFFAVLLGSAAGMTGARVTNRRASLTWCVLSVIALGCAWLESRAFLAEWRFQQAEGAQYWAREFARQGDTGQQARTLASARTLLEDGQRLLPFDYRFPENLGKVALALGQPGEAAVHFANALARHPHHPRILMALAETHANLALARIGGDDAEERCREPEFQEHLALSESFARRALASCPPLPEAHEALGRAAVLRAAPVKESGAAAAIWHAAVQHFEDALRHGLRDRAAVFRAISQAYLQLGDVTQARQMLQRAVEADPGNADGWALFERFAGEHDAQDVLIEQLTRASSRLVESGVSGEAAATVSNYLARAFVRAGDLRSAQDRARESILAQPAALKGWGFYAGLFPELERLDRLNSLYLELSDESKRLPPELAIFSKLDVAAADDRRAAAEELAQAVAEKEKRAQHAGDLVWLARLAESVWGRAPTDSAADAAAARPLAWVYIAAQEWADADRVLGAALPHLAPRERPTALVQRAQVLHELGRGDEALAAAREAVQLEPGSVTARWNLARRLADSGRLAESQFEFTALMARLRQDNPERGAILAEHAALQARIDGAIKESTP